MIRESYSSSLRNEFNLLVVTGNKNFAWASVGRAANGLDAKKIFNNLIHDATT